MLATERFFRHRIVREHLEWLEDMLAAMAVGLDSDKDRSEIELLQQTAMRLLEAADCLRDAEREASIAIAPDLIEEQLRASLELINRSPERMRTRSEFYAPCSTCGYVECICPNDSCGGNV